MKLTIRKYDPSDSSRCSFDEARSLYSSTTYDVRVHAADFISDRTSVCTVKLLRRANPSDVALTEYAIGTLIPDPYRRDVRYGTLAITDTAHALLFDALTAQNTSNILDDFILSVTLGASSSRVLYVQCPVVIAPKVVQGSGDASRQIDASSYLWTKVDLGDLTTGSNTVTDSNGIAFAIPLRDRSMTKCSVDLTTLTGSKDFIIVPTKSDGTTVFADDFFEASIVVEITDAAGCTNKGSWKSAGSVGLAGSRLREILRGSALPPQSGVVPTNVFVWDYDDSREMASSTNKFLVKVSKLPHDGQWHAEFRVANAAAIGVEIDPSENVAIPGADINNI